MKKHRLKAACQDSMLSLFDQYIKHMRAIISCRIEDDAVINDLNFMNIMIRGTQWSSGYHACLETKT
jgi:hypothetical protein